MTAKTRAEQLAADLIERATNDELHDLDIQRICVSVATSDALADGTGTVEERLEVAIDVIEVLADTISVLARTLGENRT